MVKKGGEEAKGMRLGKYELGRTLGEGNFGKVKFATDVESGQGFAVKIIDKAKIVDRKITDQVGQPGPIRAKTLGRSPAAAPSLRGRGLA